MMTREEHLAWAKKRALEYVDAGDLEQAINSMGSDLMKHPDWASSKLVEAMVYIAHIGGRHKGPDAIRRWINGFN